MYCTKCGKIVNSNDKFCASCGNPISVQSSSDVEKSNEAAVVHKDLPIAYTPEEKKKLLEYLKVVLELESNRKVMQKVVEGEKKKCDAMAAAMSTLNASKAKIRPEREAVPPEPSVWTALQNSSHRYGANDFAARMVSILWYIFCGIMILIFISLIGHVAVPGVVVKFVLLLALIISIIIIAVVYHSYQDLLYKRNYAIHANEMADKRYADECAKIDREMVDRKFRKEEQEQKTEILKKKLADIEKVLAQFYALDVIYKDFRSMGAVAYIIRYLESGMAATLGEAYRLSEEAEFRKIVVANTGEIVASLDEVKRSNMLLYDEMQNMNRKLTMAQLEASRRNDILQELNSNLDKVNRNVTESNRISAERNSVLLDMTQSTQKHQREVAEYEKYLAFAAKQNRLNNGRYY